MQPVPTRSEGHEVKRVIGRFEGKQPGPTLICLGSIHGNEPSGARAIRRVLDVLNEAAPEFRGALIGIVGNLAALARGVRFVDKDLNRIWLPEQIDLLRDGDFTSAEDAEQKALVELLDECLSGDVGNVFFLDLHTTSAPGIPFALIGDTLPNRAFALQFPVPIILGLEEQLSGTITEYVSGRGAVTVGFEAGQHTDPASVDRQEAAIWIGLGAAGNLPDGAMPQVRRSWALLHTLTRAVPPILEVRYRHAVSAADRFRMNPGFKTFQPVDRGAVLAQDRHGAVAAPIAGRILLPLYQDQGEDGFFLATPVKKIWLTVSKLLRALRADLLLPLLPGVCRDPDHSETLLVDPVIARFLAVDIFHLFGFRRRGPRSGKLVFTRRVHDARAH
ncbi:MAG: succinylglutamate desuccinylase/aspartoacylase family protein [Phycisphaerae bacterium]